MRFAVARKPQPETALRYRPILFLAVLALAGQADAQVFRWTDKDGRVHYGDDPAPTARNTREVTATINTLDMSALRHSAAESPAQSPASGASASGAVKPARAAVSYPSCSRRR